MNINEVLETVHSSIDILKIKGVHATIDQNFDAAFKEFIKTVNPNFPTDTVDVFDIISVAFHHWTLPRANEIDILKAKLHDADLYRGDLRWKYLHPMIEAQFSPKETASFYRVIFKPKKGYIPLSFPLNVEAYAYADMDDIDNHDDDCPKHEDPFADCECDAMLIHIAKTTFNDRQEFFQDFSNWLRGEFFPCEVEYDVFVKEVHTQTVRIKAKSPDDAKQKVEDGEGIQLENSLEYQYTLETDSWDVAVV